MVVIGFYIKSMASPCLHYKVCLHDVQKSFLVSNAPLPIFILCLAQRITWGYFQRRWKYLTLGRFVLDFEYEHFTPTQR